MKIVHIYKDAYPPLAAGITRYMTMVAASAARCGHEVELHVAGVRSSRRDVMPDGVVVYRWAEFGRALSNPVSPALVRAASRVKGDVVHLHMPNPVGELGALSFRGPVVSSFHAQLGKQAVLGPAYGLLQQALLRRSASVFVASPPMLDQEELRNHQDRVVVLPYGVHPALVHDRERIGQHDVLRLLFVGRLVYYKGLDVLFDSLARVHGAELTVIGEGPLRSQLDRRISTDPALSGRVVMRGGVSDEDLSRAYNEHDVFVAPSVSRAEAFGISMAEALANGLPAISTRLGTGTDWVNEDGVTGLVVEPRDAILLANAIERLRDTSLWLRLSEGARATAADRYSSRAHFEALLQHYEGAAP